MPLPLPMDKGDLVQVERAREERPFELQYQNFRVVMSRSRRFCSRAKQIGFAVVVAVAEKFAVQLERPQQLIADGFLVTFLYLPLFHRSASARSVPKLLNRQSQQLPRTAGKSPSKPLLSATQTHRQFRTFVGKPSEPDIGERQNGRVRRVRIEAGSAAFRESLRPAVMINEAVPVHHREISRCAIEDQ